MDFLYSVFIVFNRSAWQLIQTLLRWDIDLLTALTMTGFRRLTFVLAIMMKKSQISDGRCNAGAENSDHEVPVHGCVPTLFNFILSLQSSQLWQNFRLRQTLLFKHDFLNVRTHHSWVYYSHRYRQGHGFDSRASLIFFRLYFYY